MSVAFIVFAKAPVAGLAKTRLVPALGAQGAAALAARLLEHAVGEAACAAAACGGTLELCVTPHADHAAFAALQQRHSLTLTAQGEGDLGERMQRAFERTLRHAGCALLIGTDAPALDAQRLLDAEAALPGADAVFVPALDGGYALVGLQRPQPALFERMTWSVPTVMQHTRDRAAAAGLRLAEMPPVADIDEPADLVHLPLHWPERTALGAPA